MQRLRLQNRLIPVLIACALGLSCVTSTDSEYQDEVALNERDLLVAAVEQGSPASNWVDFQAGTLTLPIGENLDFYIRLDKSPWLVLERLERSQAPGGYLLISIQADRGNAAELARFSSSADLVRLSLEQWAGQIVELSLSSRGTDPQGQGTWLIESPRIQSQTEDVPDRLRSIKGVQGIRGDRPNIVVYLADTLRKDSLGLYGSADDISPNIDRFGGQATVFENATSHSPWTRPAVASIFTGLEPHRHGVNDRMDVLDPEATTIAELLSLAGYHTGSVIANGNVGPEFGLDQGFEFLSRARDAGGDKSSEATTDRASEYLQSLDLTRPFFLYIHNLDPHHPYEISDDEFAGFASEGVSNTIGSQEVLAQVRKKTRTFTPEEEQAVIRLYRGEVAYMDREFGNLLQSLKDVGLYEKTAIVFLSDHGEEFWDHGRWGHGISLYRELIDIPLIIRSPGQERGLRVAEPIRQIDVFQILLEWAGLGAGAASEGTLARGPNYYGDSVSYAKMAIDGRLGVSVTESNWKLILRGQKRQKVELYDLHEDPEERINLVSERPIVLGYMESLLRSVEAGGDQGLRSEKPAELDEDLERELMALGYLN
jgi:arylsulfatase A-like enzyme